LLLAHPRNEPDGIRLELVMLYLAIETTSIPLYILAGFMLGDEKSTDMGLAYAVRSLHSTIMLYGLSYYFVSLA
jgi:NADH-quinone oxidoreductase subunit N